MKAALLCPVQFDPHRGGRGHRLRGGTELARLVVAPAPDAPARVDATSSGQNEQLRVAFDVAVLLIAAAAFVCTGLLLAVASTSFRGDELVALGLAVFGSFTVGAGGVHLAHRLRR